MFWKFKYGIKTFYNVLTENERLIFLDEIKPLLKIINNHPGLQTDSDLHFKFDQKDLFYIIKKIIKRSNIKSNIDKSWINYTDKNVKYTNWHNHKDMKYTLVYFLENPESIGTVFKINGKEIQVNCPTNSIITFPPNIDHTVPYNITKPRYSFAIDFK